MTVLLAIDSWFQLDILAWIISIPLLVALIMVLYNQYRHSRQLKGELDQLSKVKTLSVEYELVLKTMRLCVWRVDVKTHIVTFDSDYRDYSDLLFLPPDGTIEDIVSHVLPEYQEAFNKGWNDLVSGAVDQCHLQYHTVHQSYAVHIPTARGVGNEILQVRLVRQRAAQQPDSKLAVFFVLVFWQ